MADQRVRDVFPSFAAHAKYLGHPTTGEMPFAFENDKCAHALVLVLDGIQDQAAKRSLRELGDLTMAFVGDLRHAQDCGTVLDGEFRTWLLQAAISPIRHGIARRQLTLAREWLLRAIGLDPEPTQPVTIDDAWFEPLMDLLSSTGWRVQIPLIELHWTEALFFYSWRTGDLVDVARVFAEPFLRLAVAIVETRTLGDDMAEEALRAVVQIAQWAIRREAEITGLAAWIAAIAQDVTRPREQRKAACAAMAMALGRPDARDWAARLREEFADLLIGHEPFQALASECGGEADELLGRFDELLAAAGEHSQHIARHADKGDAAYAHERMFAAVSPVIYVLLVAGACDDARRLLAAWLGADDVRESLVWLIANRPEAVAWVHGSTCEIIPSDRHDFDELVQAINLALNIAVRNATAAGDEALAGDASRNTRPEQAARFEAATLARLGIRGTGDLQRTALEQGASLLVLPWLPLPIQALSLRECGVALPLTMSLRAPGADRRIRRAFLATHRVGSGRLELDLVSAVLESAGIEVERAEAGLTKQEFEDVYRDSYDLIWIATHAVHQGGWPEESALMLGPDCRYPVDDLMQLPVPQGDRRLMVLNACETAAGSVFGGLGQFGLGGALTNERQAAVAHLWPVDDLAACAFGLLLAHALTDPATFFEAFCSALSRRIAMGAALADGVSACQNGERLAEHIRARDDDYGSFLHWASPCFLE